MDLRLLLTTALFCILSGCASLQTIDFSGESSAYYRVTTVDGRQAYGRDLVQGPDSTMWTDGVGRRERLANSDLDHVDPVRQPTGMRHWSDGLATLNARARRRVARIEYVDGRSFVIENLRVAHDSTSWLDPRTGKWVHVATAEVASVRIREGGRGALRGLGLGALAGGVLGACVGFAGGDDDPNLWLAMTAGQKAVAGGIVFGVLAAPVGALIGYFSTTTYRFHRPAPSDAPPKPMPPPGPAVISPQN